MLAVGVSYHLRQAEQAREPLLDGVPLPAARREAPVVAQSAPASSAAGGGVTAPVEANAQDSGRLQSEAAPVETDPEDRVRLQSQAARSDAGPEAARNDARKLERAASAKPAPPEPEPEIAFDEPMPMAAPAPPPPPPAEALQSAPAAPFEEEIATEAEMAPLPEPFAEAAPAADLGLADSDTAEREAGATRSLEKAGQPATRDLERKRTALTPTQTRELARIEKMIERGRTGDAKRALARFRRAHPGVEIPREITDALE